LKVFNAIASDSRRDVDPLTFAERDDRLLIVRTPPDTTAKTFQLALDPDRVDRGHLDLEQPFDGRLDLTLCGGTRKITWLCSEAFVAFSVITGERTMSNICC
jgi:hypothetical protein